MASNGPGGARSRLLNQALRALTRREHSRSELREKLLRARPSLSGAGRRQGGADLPADSEETSKPDPALIDSVLDHLTERGLLSDERFVESRLHARAPRFGLRRIQGELARHGVALEPSALDALRQTELERARTIWERKFGQPAVDPRERARHMRFLAGRGFAADIIHRVVQGGDND